MKRKFKKTPDNILAGKIDLFFKKVAAKLSPGSILPSKLFKLARDINKDSAKNNTKVAVKAVEKASK